MRFIAMLFFVLTAAAPAWAARVGFSDSRSKVPGQIVGVSAADVDGDGAQDVVVVYRRGTGRTAKRFVGIFFRGPQGLASAPDLAFAVPRQAALYDLGDLDGEPGEEMIYLSGSGVWAHGFRGRQVGPVRKIIPALSMIGDPEGGDLERWDFARELGGAPAVLVPGRRDLRVFAPGADGFELKCRVQVRQQSYYAARGPEGEGSGGGPRGGFALRVTTTLPILSFAEVTGDAHLDLVTHFEDQVALHPGQPSGCVSAKPTFRRSFRMRTPEEEREGTASVLARLSDVDGDGRADLALTKVSGGLTDLRTEIHLHRAVKGGFGPKPVQIFKSPGYGAFARFQDVDGDGQVEMIQPRAEISILGITRMLLSSSFAVDVLVRRRAKGSDRFFEEEPVQELEARFGLDFDAPNGLLGALPLFGHDFDGDGRKDVLLSKGKDALGLHRGRAGKAPFESRDPYGLEGPGSVATFVLVPGAGKRPEVLVWYPGRKGADDTLRVYRPTSLPRGS